VRARSSVGRRKILRRLLLVFFALGVVAVVVAYRIRPRHPVALMVAPQPLPENAQQAAAGYSFTRSEGGREVFTVHARRTTDYKNGQGTILEGVLMEVFGRTGDQHDLIKADRCDYNSGSGNFSCAGQVEVELDAPRGAQELPSAPAAGDSGTLHGRQPVYLKTSGLVYNQATALISGPAHVDWRYGPATGSAVGLAYATRDGSIDLERDVTATLPVRNPPNSAGLRTTSVMQLAASHLHYAKERRQIELAGPVHLTEGDRKVDSGHAILDLDARNRLTRALLDDGMQAADTSQGTSRTAQAAALEAQFDPATGDLTALNSSGDVHLESQPKPGAGITRLAADRVHVSFTGAHFHPEHGEASGNVRVASEPGSAQSGASPTQSGERTADAAAHAPVQGSFSRENLETADLDFAFRPADGTLDEAHTVGPGKLTLTSADPKTGNRIITASRFLMAFDARSRLKGLRGQGPTEIVFEPALNAPRGTVAMESHGDSLQASLDPASGGLESMEQAGHFQFMDVDRHATADRADYSADGDFMTLTGNPVVTDPNTRIRADHVLMHLATSTAEGSGHVSSTHLGGFPGEGQSGPAVKPSNAASAAGNGDPDVTNVLAERVTADRNRQVFHYEGHVRAWRGAHVIESPALDIYRADRHVVAGSGVVTSDLEPSPPSSGAGQHAQGSGASPSSRQKASPSGVTREASARDARSLDAKTRDAETRNKTSPSGSAPGGATRPVTIRADRFEYFDLARKAAYRGHVRMDSSGATLECDRLDAYFTEPGPGAPSQLDHAVADDHVTLLKPGRRATGNHADYFAREGKVVMTGGPPTLYDTEKGFTTGRSLTFFTSDDSLIVDGGSGFRSLSKHRLSQ
jgi:lipopolysaccharide export system protein LptA